MDYVKPDNKTQSFTERSLNIYLSIYTYGYNFLTLPVIVGIKFLFLYFTEKIPRVCTITPLTVKLEFR